MAVAPATAEIPGDSDRYKMVRSQIEFEAALIAQRLSWFVAAQAFLFSAYAIVLNAPHEAAVPEYARQQHLLYFLIPVVAIASCALIYAAVLGGWWAQIHLRRFLWAHVPPERLAAFPPLQGLQRTHVLGLAAPLGLPLVFVAVWIFLLTRGLA